MSEPSEAAGNEAAPRCIHLCCKAMVVFGEAFESDPEYQAGMTEFWCVQTGKGLGPDGGAAAMAPCSQPERSCYQEY